MILAPGYETSSTVFYIPGHPLLSKFVVKKGGAADRADGQLQVRWLGPKDSAHDKCRRTSVTSVTATDQSAFRSINASALVLSEPSGSVKTFDYYWQGAALKTLLTFLLLTLSISLGMGCNLRREVATSPADSGGATPQATVPVPREDDWGPPVSGLRCSLAIEPGVAEQPTSPGLTLKIHNSSDAEIRFKPVIIFQLFGTSLEQLFWAPGDSGRHNSVFPKGGSPIPVDGLPLLTLAPGESRVLNFDLGKLGWDSMKSSYYRGEGFYTIVPKGRYDLVAAFDIREGQIEAPGRVVTIPKGSQALSNRIKLRVDIRNSLKLVASGN